MSPDKEVKAKTKAPGERSMALVTKAASRVKAIQVIQQKRRRPKQLSRRGRKSLGEQQAKNQRKMSTRDSKGATRARRLHKIEQSQLF